MSKIVGTIAAKHTIDPNGSLNIDVPIQLPPANLDPGISFSYHSAAQDSGDMGPGWVIRGLALIERVGATLVQDGFQGSVNYDSNDRFNLNGQRLVNAGNNEYRYEVEQWSKVIPSGGDSSNPDFWTEYLPDGSQRIYGKTSDSNIKAQGSNTATRVWAVNKHIDVFGNYTTFTYSNESSTGAYYISNISYGGNEPSNMSHQRSVSFTYETRPDVHTRFLGGHKIYSDKRLSQISTSVNGTHVHTHSITYAVAPLTGKSRVQAITLADATGATVNPLTFDWNDAAAEVFHPIKNLNTIKPGISGPQMLPLDFNANGKTDVVVASIQQYNNVDSLYLDVYLADDSGNLSHSSSCSGTTKLDAPTHLLAISANDYGRTDLLHIESVDDDGSGNQAHVMTVLLSTDSGYTPQSSFNFEPEVFDGKYYTGDFKGDGRVGLIYVYNSEGALRLVQLVPNGTKFTALSPIDIPGGMDLSGIQVVVGDFNGDGAEDAYFIWPEANNTVASIHLVQSKNGALQYVGEVVDSASKAIEWYDDIGFVAHDAGDGLVGLLALTSDTSSQVQLQTIRSTGKTLLALSEPQSTGIPYNGRVSLARTASTNVVDVVVMSQDDSNQSVQLDVLRYNEDKWARLSNVQQPTSAQYGYTLNSMDIGGTGRADCIFSIVDEDGNIGLSSLQCAGSPTADIVSSYTNGLGAKTVVNFAPLTDSSVYTATEASASSPTAYTNALACNVTSYVPLSSGFASSDVPSRARTMLVHYPKYVVKDITTCAAPSLAPDVKSTVSYKYKNARFSPNGRGWLGFESVTQENQPQGARITATYLQDFPYLGQSSSIVTTDTSGNTLESASYSWTSTTPTSKNQSVTLASQVQGHYESGSSAFNVTVKYQYDKFGNVTTQTTSSSDSERPDCTITTEYSNDESNWILGRQTLHVVDPGDNAVSKTKFEYVPNTGAPSSVSKWVTGDTWSTQNFTYNASGKETLVTGPGPAKASFTYDQTSSFRASETFQTTSQDSFTSYCSYEYVTGQVQSVTDANGHITSMSYDVLGRPLTVSEGESLSSLTLLQKYGYSSDSQGPYSTHSTKTSWDQDKWGWETQYINGLNQVWRKMTNSPENPNTSLVQDVVYDGAGRVAQQSRTYALGTSPVFATCTFDAHNRPTKKVSPSLDPGAQPITFTYEYSYSDNRSQITERQYEGSNSTPSQVTVKQLKYYPATDPNAGHALVQPLVVKMVDSMSRNIDISFDGLCRATSATDPSGVELAVTWDGLSRQTERTITSGGKKISHFTMSFDDDKCTSTSTNVLTNALATTTYDYIKRPIQRVNADDTISLKYDLGGDNVKSRLASVTSKKGINHSYSYDSRGNLKRLDLNIDNRKFTTQYEWTPTKKVANTINPDGTSIKRTFFDNTSFVSGMDILDSSKNGLLFTTYSDFNTATYRPNKCTLGKNLVSTVTTADNGVLTSSTLKKASDTVHSQTWQLDSFSKIQQYTLTDSKGSATNQFTYDASGQLTGFSSTGESKTNDTFTYDDSGNLVSQNSDSWNTDGWQLSSIKDSSGNLLQSFKYSPDGNLTAKMNGSGDVESSLTYDSDGRLITVNNSSFVYDYQGRVIKATRSDGSVSYYPNPEYDVLVKASGDETSSAHILSGWRRGFVSTDTVGGKAQTPKARYLQTDHLGSVVAVLDSDGSVLTTYTYDAYGKATVSGEDTSRYTFSGKEEFEGLFYFGARFYDPKLRRFVSLDNYTVSLENITPQSFNQYTYARNDPANYIDLNGNVPWWHWLVAGALIVVGVIVIAATDGAATPLVFWAGAIIGGALLGAGTSALQTDLMAEVYNNGKVDEKEWWKSMAIGAAIGAVTGAAGGAFGKFVAPRLGGAILNRLAGSSSSLFKSWQPFTKWAGTTLVQFGLKTGQQVGLSAVFAFAKSFAIHEAFSIIVGVGGQLVKNAMAGESWDHHLWGVLWISAVTGAASASASGLTAGAFKKVGTELVAESGEGFIDAFRATAGYVKEDSKILAMLAELWGWDRIASMFNKI